MAVIVLSILTLFLRGFTFKGFSEQLHNKNLETPSMKVWLIQTQGYSDKMDAYKAGVAAAKEGLGVYVISDNSTWRWVAGAYTTQVDAENIIQDSVLLTKATSCEYEIKSKKINLSADVIEPCRQIFTAVCSAFDKLLNLRVALNNNTLINEIMLELTSLYNTIKSATSVLQTQNSTLKSDLVSAIIYTANQNILSLNDIVSANNDFSMATINTALLKTIFSLDNF
ncbi:MAG: hypothetical protein IJ295_02595 [Clostridia bacterium]|nr:hypothetical protein [Clostridia bacterium]